MFAGMQSQGTFGGVNSHSSHTNMTQISTNSSQPDSQQPLPPLHSTLNLQQQHQQLVNNNSTTHSPVDISLNSHSNQSKSSKRRRNTNTKTEVVIPAPNQSTSMPNNNINRPPIAPRTHTLQSQQTQQQQQRSQIGTYVVPQLPTNQQLVALQQQQQHTYSSPMHMALIQQQQQQISQAMGIPRPNNIIPSNYTQIASSQGQSYHHPDWLSDERAYVEQQQENIYKCLKLVSDNIGHDWEAGRQVYAEVQKFVRMFKNDNYKRDITQWLNCFNSNITNNTPNLPVQNVNIHSLPTQNVQQIVRKPPPNHNNPNSSHVSSSNIPPENEPIFQRVDPEAQNVHWRLEHKQNFSEPELRHRQSYSDMDIKIHSRDLNRIYRPENPFIPTITTEQRDLPLSIRLICRKTNRHDEDKCEWPEGLSLYLDGNPLPFEKRVKQMVNGRNDQFVYNGIDRPLDLSNWIRNTHHRLRISVPGNACCCTTQQYGGGLECRSNYRFSIEYLLRETRDIVLHNARRNTIPLEDGIKVVNRLVSGNNTTNNDDVMIVQTVVKVCMKCPLTLTRIKEPVKGVDCRHVACFDLTSYVEVNRIKQTWNCPEFGCRNKVTADKLRTDLFFKKLLDEVPQDATMIELGMDGSWKPVSDGSNDGDTDSERHAKKTKPAPRNEPNNQEVIVLDDSDDDDNNKQDQQKSEANNNHRAPIPSFNNVPINRRPEISIPPPTFSRQTIAPAESNNLISSSTSPTIGKSNTPSPPLPLTPMDQRIMNLPPIITSNHQMTTKNDFVVDSNRRLTDSLNSDDLSKTINNARFPTNINSTNYIDDGSLTEEEEEEVMDSGRVIMK
ncbi:8088_t:CDS:10 [Ambispora leptoticha]|uniref:8088_t:CDS:1 n=1 Tax=Ambispora leptoticha TaxID=144679 RepID=A0A9N8VH98_9GLOM|nr:8088_t:CDS:10 [Ambispora leptoticha]